MTSGCSSTPGAAILITLSALFSLIAVLSRAKREAVCSGSN
ncbi:MYXO-CTERM sorting domain-containing protein [Bacteroides sp. 214]